MITCEIFQSLNELEQWRNKQTSKICFVPTMGSLHHGHGELIKQAKESNENKLCKVLVSIFVNPLQFSANEDFEKYPRNLAKDSELAFQYGADAIWSPSLNDLFPNGEEEHFQIRVPSFLKSNLCGAKRNNHFDGVASVILRLLISTKPHLLILGEKDWQQLIIIRNLLKDLKLSIKIKSVATVRDEDGLATSSRNSYLSSAERLKAIALPKILEKAFKENQEGKPPHLQKLISELKQKGLDVEYLEVVDPYRMQNIKNKTHFCLLAAAVHCGRTRLIDHKFLMKRQPIVAIDGPAGAGKSTVTKAFAQKMGLTYLDTGAMYRAVTFLLNQKDIAPNDHIEIRNILMGLSIRFENSPKGTQKVILNEVDVTEKIRSPEVTSLVSKFAAEKPIREFLTNQQQNMGKKGGLVAEGRDVGTTVFPDAELKIFLTASSRERARRRSIDLKEQGFVVPKIEDLEKEITTRDLKDSNREISPLIKAKDAFELLSDGMSIEEVVSEIIDLFRSKVPNEVWPNP